MFRLEFKQVDKNEVKILAVDDKEVREVGTIFTPGGSGHTNMNAIQICGFTEAYDLWGCAVYGEPAVDVWEYKRDKRGKIYEQVKDIQLKFDWETKPHKCGELGHVCHRCFNKPCTCEVHIKYENPYVIKREQDLNLMQKKKPLLGKK